MCGSAEVRKCGTSPVGDGAGVECRNAGLPDCRDVPSREGGSADRGGVRRVTLPSVTVAGTLAAAALVAVAAAASAQDGNPLEDAVRAQEALRARQSVQIMRADDRVVDPYRVETPTARAPVAPVTAPTSHPGKVGIGPWVLAGGVAAAVALFYAMRRREPRRR